MKNLAEEITNLRNNLSKNEIFPSIRNRKSPGEKKIKPIAKKYKFPQELKDFYLTYDGLFLAWFSKKDFLSIARLYIPDHKTFKSYMEDTADTDLKRFSKFIKKGYMPFDVDNINHYVTFINGDQESYELVRVDGAHHETNLNISISDYLKMGIAAGGLFHWQNYISKNTFKEFKKYSYDRFFEMLKKNIGDSALKDFYHDDSIKDLKIFEAKTIKIDIPKKAQIKDQREDLGCSNVEIRKAELGISQKLPIDFIKWCYTNNGMQLHWALDKAFGNFELLGISKIFGGPNHSQQAVWQNSYATHLELDESHEKEYGHFYPFIFEEAGHTVFRIEKDQIQLYFIEDLEPEKINLSFIQFLEKMSACGGISGWQKLFIKRYSMNNPDIEDLMENIKTCFPQMNLNTFLK